MIPYPALVRWNDAHGDPTEQLWDLANASHTPLVIDTLGWVTKEDEVGVGMFTERVDNQDGTYSWRGRGFIPRGMVVSITHLAGKKPRKAKA